MIQPTMEPLADVPLDPLVAALPKADLHVHQEAQMRLDRVLARREGRSPYDWRSWAQRLLAETPPGMLRLDAMADVLPFDHTSDDDPEVFISRMVDLLEEEAADGAMLVEVISGPDAALRSDFIALFREAERRVQQRYPRIHAEAIGWLQVTSDTLPRAERQLEAYLLAARKGLAGINLRIDPYDTEADPALWSAVYQVAQRAADAGLGITVHAGEFSPANLSAAINIPGLARIGHAVYAASDPHLLELLVNSGTTIECCLTANVLLGSVPSYAEHPIRRFVESGVPVTLGTDNPVRIPTTIGREYAVAASLGFTAHELLGFTRNAIRASFAPRECICAMLSELNAWETEWLNLE